MRVTMNPSPTDLRLHSVLRKLSIAAAVSLRRNLKRLTNNLFGPSIDFKTVIAEYGVLGSKARIHMNLERIAKYKAEIAKLPEKSTDRPDPHGVTDAEIVDWADAFRRFALLKPAEKHYALSASSYEVSLGQLRHGPTQPMSLNEFYRLFLEDVARTHFTIGMAQGTLDQIQRYGQRGAQARLDKNLRPKREAAEAAARRLLSEEPTLSANAIAELLIGRPDIRLKHRTLAEIASAEKKRAASPV